jgi:hypothetical protein
MSVAQLTHDGMINTPGLRLYAGRKDGRQAEIRRVGFLVDAWVMAQEQPVPDPEEVSKFERRLHDAIKRSSLHGLILSFAGLNLWVDERTPEGVVEMQESINL